MGSPRAWIVLFSGVVVYASAVLQRTSFGVAGVQAVDRFGASAGLIGLFVVLQLVVYAGLQVPVGVLLDRFGTRTLVSVGAATMFMGQILMASADSIPEGLIARVLVGAGDAMTFGSVIRLVPAWFPAKRVPLLTQLTGLLGQSGQIASAVPFAYVLEAYGWRTAFLGAAAVAATALVLALGVVRNAPPGAAPIDAGTDPDRIVDLVVATWRTPGTRLGLWTHFSTSFSPMVFAMMWGFPYLISGEGREPAQASALFTLYVLASLPCGPLLGSLTQRYPYRRSNLVFAIVAANILPWILVLAWPGPAPTWLLVVLALGLATGGPGSAIGFDFARTSNPAHRLGTATGIVIMGGFGAALVSILIIGVVIDVLTGFGASPLAAHRWAMATQFPLFAIGLLGIVSTRRKTRALMAGDGARLDPLHAALRRKYRARRRPRDPRR
ncbi:MFS transporter [Gephyromycinifex aptenodytis]|uniref:MFS transporter n=1 Tax=Gephyromycinifex aptenodytis TaxID=2716227 RepID=UPI0014470CAB|nr:MFS transporter [Gephyromycinifex aptenodytis]